MLLLTLLTGQRGQALHSLRVSDVRMFSQKCVINFSEKHKHTRPGCHTEPANILAFSGNDRLCLVKHFRAYLDQTKDLRQREANLFISSARPHKAVSRDTFSRLVKLVLAAAGIDTEHFGSHSICAASTSEAARRGITLATIMKAGGWSSQKTFCMFYNKAPAQNFGQAVMDSCMKKS